MAIKDSLRTLLLAQSSITTLAPAQTISSKSYDAIFVETVKQGIKPPYIVITDNDFDPMKTLDGTTGMGMSDIDIECHEWTETEAEALAKAVTDYLKDYSGAAGSDTIYAVLWNNKQAFAGQEQDGSNKWRVAITLNFEIQHS